MRTPDPVSSHVVIDIVKDVFAQALPNLSAAISEVKERVCASHIATLRKKYSQCADLSDAAVLDDLGVVMDCFAETLKKSADIELLAQLGPAHATVRFAQHFSLVQVSGEYVYFRRALHRELENSYGPLSRIESEAL